MAHAILDRPAYGDTFEIYAGPFPVPALQPGDIVIMNGLSCRKRQRIVEPMQAFGVAVLNSPATSPNVNSIEEAFFNRKALLRKAGEHTPEGPRVLVVNLVDLITSTEALDFISHGGQAELRETLGYRCRIGSPI